MNRKKASRTDGITLDRIKIWFGRMSQLWSHRKSITKVVRQHLFFLETEQSIFGSISKEDEEGIAYAVSKSSAFPGVIVEIGCLFGHTTNLLATLKEKERRLIAVENFCWNPFGLPKRDHQIFTQRTLRYALDNCATEIYSNQGGSFEFYESNPQLETAMVFIDADHSYEAVKKDIQWAKSVGCAVISGHDYHQDMYPGIVRAVKEEFGDDYKVFGTVWVHENKDA